MLLGMAGEIAGLRCSKPYVVGTVETTGRQQNVLDDFCGARRSLQGVSRSVPHRWSPVLLRFVGLICLLCALPVVRAKTQSGPLRIGGFKKENSWKYVSKFGYGVGRGNYSMKMKLMSPKTIPESVSLSFTVYLDEDWDKVDAEADVCERVKHSRQTQTVLLRSDGEWSEEVTGGLNQNVRPHIWYFAVSDCDNRLQNYTHRVKFEFRAQQEDGSEFSFEMKGMLTMNILWLMVLLVFVYDFCKKGSKFRRSAGSIHPVIWTLSVAMLLQFVAQVFHTIHLLQYRNNGSGIKALEVFSEILAMLSQVVQTTLLILIGLGYTVLQSKIGELDIIIPMAFMIGVIQIMLVGFGKIKDDAAYKFHENEGVIGWILLVVRLLLYAWFLWAVQSSSSEGSMSVQRFYRQFGGVGTVYFMMYPAVFLVTKLFAPYWQHGVMTVGMMIMQMGSNAWLGTLFLTRGDYFKVSTLSASELPGGCKVGVVKEE